MTTRRGGVWYGSVRVGSLGERPDGEMRFSYEPAWVGEGFPISLSLPLSEGIRELDAHAFFAGLLPEGLSRQRVCRQYRLNEEDDLGLLLTIGRDCAGALAVLPDDAEPGPEGELRALTDDEIGRLIDSRGQAMPEGPGQRFSLAGAQDKLAVRIEGDKLWLPDSHRPSSHILKFETTRWVCFAEWAGNALARRVGLVVPTVEYRVHPGAEAAPYLVIERYDRALEAGELRRLHQEDVLQAMGWPSRLKYEEHGGPSLGAVAALLRRHSADPVTDVTTLRDWQIFNYLAGNSDGHAKNLAFLYPMGSAVLRLAPAYDLVCIEFLNRLGIRYDRRLAFMIGGKNVAEQIAREEWTGFASTLGVPKKSVLERLRSMAETLVEHAVETRSDFAQRFGDNQAYDRFEESIRDRCEWTLRSVFGKG